MLFTGLFPRGLYSQEADSQGAGSQESNGSQSRTIPDALLRPERGESPRYPKDVVIGDLGRGNTPEGAYRFAMALLSAIAAGSTESRIITESSGVLAQETLEQIISLEPRTYRIGSGRIETDGSVSYLIRFLGTEDSLSGELFIRQPAAETPPEAPAPDDTAIDEAAGEEKWLLDDLIIEEKKALSEIRDSYRYDFSPYERFY